MRGYDKQMPGERHLSPAEGPYVQIEDVSKRFGPIEAVSHISLKADRGNILGIVGSDGAGKSTLLRMVATMIKPSSVRILIGGLDVMSQKTEVKSLLGYMPQRFGLYQDLTVGENLDFFMDIFGILGPERKRRRERYLGFSNLIAFIDRLAMNPPMGLILSRGRNSGISSMK
jgi:ABC-2 type transport system ATP-binding protein